ncbi:MAG: NAD+ synthase, partial [Rhodocyclales bacterium]|nr:NAD+ synthase [Rhodocyclales bacterium]
MKRLRVAVAQFNAHVGDLAGNAARIVELAARARDGGADVLLTPELALSGYPPEDLLMRPDFYRACAAEIDVLARAVALPVVVGYPEDAHGQRYNAASLLANGTIVATYRKHRLPNYEVFDEERYFAPGHEPCVIDLNGVRCGLAICADVWESGAAESAALAGAELMLTLNASPFHMNKQERRYEVLRERVAATGKPVIYANLVGGQDELVFDGASFAMDGKGRLTHQLPAFVEALEFIDYADGGLLPGRIVEPPSREAEVYAALKLGVADYLGKNGFPGAIIGLSGGIDSALTLAIAVDALGAGQVRAVMMPSPWTAQISLDDSREMVKRLGVQYDEIPIAAAMDQFAALLAPTFAGLGPKPA